MSKEITLRPSGCSNRKEVPNDFVIYYESLDSTRTAFFGMAIQATASGGDPLFEPEDDREDADLTTQPDKAMVAVAGVLHENGCAQVVHRPNGDPEEHYCCLQEALVSGRILSEIYDIVATSPQETALQR